MAELTQVQKIVLLAIVTFASIAGMFVVGRLASKALVGDAMARAIFEAHPAAVSWIALECDDGQQLSIRDRGSIEAVLAALNVAEAWSPNHPQCRERCRLTVHEKATSVTVPVRWACRDPREGVLIDVYSQSTWGFHFGTWRSVALEAALVAARAGRAPTKATSAVDADRTDR